MSTSFEFLAAFDEWEHKAQGSQPEIMDTCPFPRGPRSNSFDRCAHAELLKVLTADTNLDSIAKNGRPGKGKNQDGKIEGFPRLAKDHPCKFLDCEQDGKWEDWVYPSPEDLRYLPDGSTLLQVDVILQSPFFSRDDRTFYPTENVLKRHHVFMTPYLAAAGLKGLLRWAWTMAGEKAEDADLVFGTANDTTEESSSQGLLHFYPVFWTGTVGLDVINPQIRTSGAGSNPIKYEIVKPGSRGSIYLLLVNREGTASRLLPAVWRALCHLIRHGGLSAKNSVGWGQVRFGMGRLAIRGLLSKVAQEKKNQAQAAQNSKAARWDGLLDQDGNLKPFEQIKTLLTRNRLKALGITEVALRKKYNNKPEQAYEALRQKGEWKTDCAAQPAARPAEQEKGPDWLLSSSSAENFAREMEQYLQEMSVCQK